MEHGMFCRGNDVKRLETKDWRLLLTETRVHQPEANRFQPMYESTNKLINHLTDFEMLNAYQVPNTKY